MGAGQTKTKKKAAQHKNPATQIAEQKKGPGYDEDVLDVANITRAIQKEDLTAQVELFFQCEQLPEMDAFSKTDAMVIVYMEVDGQDVLQGHTEMIPEDLNPKFVRTVVVNYNNEKKQKLRFDVVDVDDFNQIENLKAHEPIGSVECDNLNDIMFGSTQFSKQLYRVKNNEKKQKTYIKNAILHVRGAEYDSSGNKIEFELGCQSFSSRSDIVLRMSYCIEGNQWLPVHVTETIKNQKKAVITWKPFQLNFSKFGNNEQAQVKFAVEEFSMSKGTTLLGESDPTSLQYLLENSGKVLRMSKSNMQVGWLRLVKVSWQSRFSFLSYIYSGVKIQTILALDFTNSNKAASESNSLVPNKASNEYIKAIRQILGIIQYYNVDDRYPVYGFGAKLPPQQDIVSHCFACSSNIFDPYICGGIEPIVDAYQDVLNSVVLHGPTVFSQVIQQAIEFAQLDSKDQQNQKYFLLLILTDGNINDLQQTIDKIYEAQHLPLSIVIVGIGDEDFTNMKLLDGDDPHSKLYSKAHKDYVTRDLVQFVDYKRYCSDEDLLMKETWAEIPRQFLEYMNENKIFPIKGKKNSKAATNDFIHSKIEEKKKQKKKEGQEAYKVPHFLVTQKEKFTQQLISLGYDSQMVSQIIADGIPAKDVNLVIEFISRQRRILQEFREYAQEPKTEIALVNTYQPRNSNMVPISQKVNKRVFCIKQKNKLDEVLMLKKEDVQKATTKFLSELPMPKQIEGPKNPPLALNTLKSARAAIYEFEGNLKPQNAAPGNLCLGCQTNPIQLVFMPCGHACSCKECFFQAQQCVSCKQPVQLFAQIMPKKG